MCISQIYAICSRRVDAGIHTGDCSWVNSEIIVPLASTGGKRLERLAMATGSRYFHKTQDLVIEARGPTFRYRHTQAFYKRR